MKLSLKAGQPGLNYFFTEIESKAFLIEYNLHIQKLHPHPEPLGNTIARSNYAYNKILLAAIKESVLGKDDQNKIYAAYKDLSEEKQGYGHRQTPSPPSQDRSDVGSRTRSTFAAVEEEGPGPQAALRQLRDALQLNLEREALRIIRLHLDDTLALRITDSLTTFDALHSIHAAFVSDPSGQRSDALDNFTLAIQRSKKSQDIHQALADAKKNNLVLTEAEENIIKMKVWRAMKSEAISMDVRQNLAVKSNFHDEIATLEKLVAKITRWEDRDQDFQRAIDYISLPHPCLMVPHTTHKG